ncbi:hypothetical protein N7493_008251 [Penicillium malachiteum]|uniref:Transcription elongation factor SPT4 n=1 Tax=Penicillium malachiteum TaxID=1324776 RepID=A0AAD6HGU3_9EURO|nr:hypothetical protein N7493_008251 [Penicillium malachiteum]
MSFYAAPNQQRYLRACMVCSIVQSHTKFQRDGCPNCETSLQLRGNLDAIQECTSQVFEGLISVRDPSVSWVARWQRLDNYVPGTYATKVTGVVSFDTTLLLLLRFGTQFTNIIGVWQLPDYIIGTLEDSGVKYVPRDGSTGEEDV